MANEARHSAARGGVKGADRGPVWVLGAMPGPALRGVDAAMILTDGREVLAFGPTGALAYDPAQRAAIRAALGRWPDEDGVAEAAEVVETAHARLLSRFERAELIGFHGQTLAHDSVGRRTHQAGDGAILAEILGLPVVWDFRSADVTLGGRGTPLAPVFHHACARFIGADAPLAFVDLDDGGSLSWVDPSIADPTTPGALLAIETGRGMADAGLLDAAAALPHSQGMQIGPSEQALVPSGADADATHASGAARAVEEGLRLCPSPPDRLLVTGAGRGNAALMAALQAACPCPVAPGEAAGLDGARLEAQAIAFLAVRVLRGMPTSTPATTGVAAPVGGGRHSRPGDL